MLAPMPPLMTLRRRLRSYRRYRAARCRPPCRAAPAPCPPPRPPPPPAAAGTPPTARDCWIMLATSWDTPFTQETKGLMDGARHVIGHAIYSRNEGTDGWCSPRHRTHHLTQETKVQNKFDDVASAIHQSLRPAPTSHPPPAARGTPTWFSAASVSCLRPTPKQPSP